MCFTVFLFETMFIRMLQQLLVYSMKSDLEPPILIGQISNQDLVENGPDPTTIARTGLQTFSSYDTFHTPAQISHRM
jgi:hypothetical protein